MGPVTIPSLLPVVTDVEMCSEQVLYIMQGILQKDETLDTTFEFMDVFLNIIQGYLVYIIVYG